MFYSFIIIYLRGQKVCNVLATGEVGDLAHDYFLYISAQSDWSNGYGKVSNVDEIRGRIVRN